MQPPPAINDNVDNVTTYLRTRAAWITPRIGRGRSKPHKFATTKIVLLPALKLSSKSLLPWILTNFEACMAEYAFYTIQQLVILVDPLVSEICGLYTHEK